MADYLVISCKSDSVLRAEKAVCLKSDADALFEAVRQATKTQGAEVWLGNRLICRVPAKAD